MPPSAKYAHASKLLLLMLFVAWGFFASCHTPFLIAFLRSGGALYLLVAALVVLALTVSAKRARVALNALLWYLAAFALALCVGAELNVLYALTSSLLEALTSPHPLPPAQLLRRLPRHFPTAVCGGASHLAYLTLIFAAAMCMIRLPSAEIASATRTLAKIALALLLALTVTAATLLAVIEIKYRVETLGLG